MRNRVIAACGLGLLVAGVLVLRPWVWGVATGGGTTLEGAGPTGAGDAQSGGTGEQLASDAGGGGGSASRTTWQSPLTPAAAAGASLAAESAGISPTSQLPRQIAMRLQGPRAAGEDELAEASESPASVVMRLHVNPAGAFGAPLRLWQPAKYLADLNADGELDLFDLVEFQRLLEAGDMSADFDGDGSLDIMDSVAFQSEMAAKTLAPDETPTTFTLHVALIEAAAESRLDVFHPAVELDVRRVLEQALDR